MITQIQRKKLSFSGHSMRHEGLEKDGTIWKIEGVETRPQIEKMNGEIGKVIWKMMIKIKLIKKTWRMYVWRYMMTCTTAWHVMIIINPDKQECLCKLSIQRITLVYTGPQNSWLPKLSGCTIIYFFVLWARWSGKVYPQSIANNNLFIVAEDSRSSPRYTINNFFFSILYE